MTPLYQEAHLVIAPESRAFGVKTKVLEAMSHAKAVVTTEAGVRGIDVKNMIHYVEAPWRPEEFAQAILDTLAAPNQIVEIGTNARLLIERFHSAEATSNAIDAALARLL